MTNLGGLSRWRIGIMVLAMSCIAAMAAEPGSHEKSGTLYRVLDVQARKTLRKEALWGLLSRQEVSVVHTVWRFEIHPTSGNLFDVEVRIVDGERRETSDGGSRVQYRLTEAQQGRLVATGTWNPGDHSWKKLDIALGSRDIQFISPDMVREILDRAGLGHDSREEDGTGAEDLRIRYDFDPDVPTVDANGRFERRASVTVVAQGKPVGVGTLTMEGQVDPECGFASEAREHLDVELSIGGHRAEITGDTAYSLKPVEEGESR